MGNELLDRIYFHSPPTVADALLLAALVGAIGFVARRRAGGPFAIVTAGLGFGCYAFLEPHPYIPAAILLALLLSPRPRLEPDERRRAVGFLREILILGLGFLLYEIGRMLTVGDYDVAVRNAERLVAFQRAIGLPSEAPVQELVLRSELVVRLLNRIYSFAFLSTVVGVLLWLYLNDRATYRIFRAGLGMAALLTVATVAVFPVAPPRLLPGSGLVSTHELMGRDHDYLNPYAAVPSNHVGWSVLAGVVLAIAIGGRRGVLIGAIPAVTMSFTVLATGHHYWLDGVVGTAYALTPLAAIGALRVKNSIVERRLTWERARVALLGAGRWGAIHAGSLLLALLLGYLLIGQLVNPGFTDYWWYQVGQVSFTLAIFVLVEGRRRRPPIFTWETRAIVVGTTWIDCLGTAGHFYDRFPVYDKIVHFAGGAAITAVAAEVITLLAKNGKLGWRPGTQVLVAIALGVLCGAAWELYEYLGDKVFNTGRVQGTWDTRYDLISDSAGAVVSALLVVRRRALAREAAAPAPAGELVEAD